MIKLVGDKVRDTVTGFTGTVTARCEYLHGTPSVLIEPEQFVEGQPEQLWVDEQRVEAA